VTYWTRQEAKAHCISSKKNILSGRKVYQLMQSLAMKLLLIILLSLLNFTSGDSSDPHSILLAATVTDTNEDFIRLEIEGVMKYGNKIYVLPEEGDEITVRLPSRRPPEKHSRILIELREKVSVGPVPSSYIMLDYQTIE
jgi:hypothetical protein